MRRIGWVDRRILIVVEKRIRAIIGTVAIEALLVIHALHHEIEITRRLIPRDADEFAETRAQRVRQRLVIMRIVGLTVVMRIGEWSHQVYFSLKIEVRNGKGIEPFAAKLYAELIAV